MPQSNEIVNEQLIFELIEKTANPKKEKVLYILDKSLEKKGLELEKVATLLNTEDLELTQRMFDASGKIKREIYGERIVLFAPLYVSNFCVNNCDYCAFHARNPSPRKKLTIDEVKEQTRILVEMGHKRLILEFGEHPKENPIDYVAEVIREIYNTKSNHGEIRRVNVNIAATTVENYRILKEAGIGTYQLFQETYHKETFKRLHSGPKADFERQLFAHIRAFEAGIDDLGIGVLFGLFNPKFEVLSLLSHAKYMDKTLGVGPHTISFPRWQPADTVDWAKPPYNISENELLKIISIMRMAVPYTGMILSTRESPETRAKAFEIGISQTSAASRTSPGGYGKDHGLEQFSLADHRSLDEVVKSVLKQGLLPSFCTACYRSARTGDAFMRLAKTGDIQTLCRPNAILTFHEYLEDYATSEVKKLGSEIVEKYLGQINNPQLKKETNIRLERITNGERDLYF